MWFALALLSGLLFAANRLIVRSALTKRLNPIVFGAAHELLAGLLLLPIGVYSFSLPHSPKIWLALLLGIFFIFLCDLFAFLALEKIEASIYQIINQLRHIIVLFGAFFLFAEAITWIKVVSIFFIIAGVYVALIARSKVELTKGTLLALGSTICISLAFLFIKMATVDVAPAFSASLSLIFSGLCISGVMLVKQIKPSQFVTVIKRKQLFAASLLFAFFEFVFFSALAIGQASKVTPVSQSSMIFTILGGYLFLSEKDKMRQKIFGCLLIIVGIILLYFI